MTHKLTGTAQPWYRHRWPWLLMLGPFVVVVAGLITAWLAVRSNDGLVDDDYYKQGLAVNQATSRNQRALELDLHAELTFDNPHRLLRVVLRSSKAVVFPATLKLSIAHPTRSGRDQALLLRADGPASYSAGLVIPLNGRWRITLEDDAREWRLADDWEFEKQPVLTLSGTLKGTKSE